MRLLLISVLAIFLVVLLTPNAFAVQYPVLINGGVADNRGMNFLPSVIEIEKGDTIKWKNLERGVYHTVTSASGLFDERLINCAYFEAGVGICGSEQNQANKQTFSYTFEEFGTYDYNCKLHSWMNGVVKVIKLGQDAEIQIHGYAGDMYIDKSVYEVGAHPIQIKIYGTVKNPGGGEYVQFAITNPNGDTESQTTFIKQNGEYSHVISVNHDDVGTYTTTSTFAGDNIGTTSFTIVKRSIPEELIPKQDYESLGLTEGVSKEVLTVNTDLSSYKKGDMIKISGIIPYHDGWKHNTVQLIIQIFDPKNNLVTVSQFFPNEDRTYSASINSNGPMWKFEGDYITRTSYTNEQASTKFFLTMPPTLNSPSPIESPNTRTATFLKLDSLDNTFRVEDLDSRASMTFSGQLLKIDRQSTIPGAAITFAFTGFTMDGNDYHKITTDNNGKFDFGITMPVGEGYAVQAVYDGSLNYKSSKSQTEYFDIVSQSLAPPEDSSPIGGVFSLVTIFIILVVAIIAIKKRKKKIQPPPTIPSGGGTPGGGTPGGGTPGGGMPGGGMPGGGMPGGGIPGRRRAQAGAKVISNPFGGSSIWKLIGKPPIVPGGLKKAAKKAAKKAVKKKSKIRNPKYELRCKKCGDENLIDGMDGLQICSAEVFDQVLNKKVACGWRNQ